MPPGHMRSPGPAFKTFQQSRWYKRLLWAGAASLVYVLVGFFVLPPIVKSRLVKRLPPVTKRQAAVHELRFNPPVLSHRPLRQPRP